MVAYGGFALVDSSSGLVLARGMQGIAATGIGLLSLAMIGALGLALVVIIGGLTGGMTPLIEMVAQNQMAFVGGIAGAVVLFAIVGWLALRKA